MEYLDGIDLESLVARIGPLPYARAVRILMQICEALDEAHQRGVIHRDIKPANVILCCRGTVPDFVKVVDFGLVKEMERDANVSAVGTIAGTPAYLAPEALTDPSTVGPAADLYAVGALGYFLVTGKMVFEGESAVAVCAQHLSTPPPPPSSRTDRAVPGELERLLLACLAKKPSERPASARALAESLAAIPINGWTTSDATAWWARFERGEPEPVSLGVADTMAVLPRAG
jgi:serine/threonine-protein kinase